MKDKYPIYRNLKMLPNRGGRPGSHGATVSKYPWSNMLPGDAVCLGPYTKRLLTNSLTSANHSYHAIHEGWRYEARKIGDELYVWRTDDMTEPGKTTEFHHGYKIIKDMEMPNRYTGAVGSTGRPVEPDRTIYPIGSLRIGDAVDVAPYTTHDHQSILNYFNRSYWAVAEGFRFTSRKMKIGGEDRLMIWRKQ